MASILKPASEAIPLVMKMLPNGKTCNVPQFMECSWKLPRTERRGEKLFASKCAVDSGCKPELTKWQEMRQPSMDTHEKVRDVERAFNRLADGISRDFEMGR